MRILIRSFVITFLVGIIGIPLTSPVLAAPAPWGIAINTETHECAGYWSGDEFSHIPLPEGWDAYYPDFEEGNATISTPIGSCTFDSEEMCCQQLGYEYVSDNIGVGYVVDNVSELDDSNVDGSMVKASDPTLPVVLLCISCCGLGGIAVLVSIIIIVSNQKKRVEPDPTQ